MRKARLHFSLPVSILREGKHYVVYTPALDLSTSGKSYEQAKKRFEEAAVLFIEETTKRGTLNEALRDLGWRKVRSTWQPPIVVSQEMQEVSV